MDVNVSGVAANALGARRIGDICFGLAKAQGVGSVLVSDDAILTAQRWLWREMRQLVEPRGRNGAGGADVGGVSADPAEERVAVLLCGGNVAPDPLV